jgi:hypothetical protein
MCPGLTHKNVVAELAANPVENNTPVAVLAEVRARPYISGRAPGAGGRGGWQRRARLAAPWRGSWRLRQILRERGRMSQRARLRADRRTDRVRQRG